jgi:hypothetical protein
MTPTTATLGISHGSAPARPVRAAGALPPTARGAGVPPATALPQFGQKLAEVESVEPHCSQNRGVDMGKRVRGPTGEHAVRAVVG